MAAKKSSTNNESKGFMEFSFSGSKFGFSGRLYPDKKREAGKLTIIPMTLCFNGLVTIKGCSYYETSKNCWIGGPQYKSGDEYKEYWYLDKELNEDMDNLASMIAEMLETK